MLNSIKSLPNINDAVAYNVVDGELLQWYSENYVLEPYEKKGFDCLLDKDYKGALSCFITAENIYPGYHNCYEIGRYLKSNNDLSDKSSPKWNELYNKLVVNWSWGMDKEYKHRFKNN